MAVDAGVVGTGAVLPLTRVGASTVVLLALCGFGPTRLLLPAGLRRHEALWVLMVGGCALGLTMTVLGFAGVPFDVSLAAVALAGAGLAALALRRRPLTGGGARGYLRGTAWPAYLAVLLAMVALVPLFRAGFATVEGQGQDAHLAVGTGMFLQHHYPLSTHVADPVDQVPLVWRSKQPIYYALGAVARVSGKEVFETISVVQALLLALSALGFFLLARELTGAPRWAALGAMALVGLDRMVLHTAMHPYYNQMWGFAALPYALVLSAWLVRERTRGGAALLAALLAILAFAYPLALPIPLLALGVVLWPERRRLRGVLRVYRGRRSLLWLVPLAVVLVVPLVGVWEKMAGAASLLLSTRPLSDWGGDLTGWFPEPWFFGARTWAALVVVGPLLVALGWRALRAADAPARRALLALLAFGAVFAVYFRLRSVGYYFHFKTLAFIAPIAVALGAAGAARVRRVVGVTALAALLVASLAAARSEVNATFDQLPRPVLALRDVDARLPPGASIRLDVVPAQQNWVAFWLHGQRLCSRRPLLHTSYPHVAISRRADYVLAPRDRPRPADAAGGPVMTAGGFALWRQRPGAPGRDRCSQRMVQTVTGVSVR